MKTCQNYRPMSSTSNTCLNCYESLVDHIIEHNLDLDKLEMIVKNYNYFHCTNGITSY